MKKFVPYTALLLTMSFIPTTYATNQDEDDFELQQALLLSQQQPQPQMRQPQLNLADDPELQEALRLTQIEYEKQEKELIQKAKQASEKDAPVNDEDNDALELAKAFSLSIVLNKEAAEDRDKEAAEDRDLEAQLKLEKQKIDRQAYIHLANQKYESKISLKEEQDAVDNLTVQIASYLEQLAPEEQLKETIKRAKMPNAPATLAVRLIKLEQELKELEQKNTGLRKTLEVLNNELNQHLDNINTYNSINNIL